MNFPMDHDAGWAAQEINLASREADGRANHLTLPCHWIEYVHVWDDDRPAHFLISVGHTHGLSGSDWLTLTFKDGSGKSHRHKVADVQEVSPLKVRLTKVS